MNTWQQRLLVMAFVLVIFSMIDYGLDRTIAAIYLLLYAIFLALLIVAEIGEKEHAV
jgi:Ca2+/Na+ antiporter